MSSFVVAYEKANQRYRVKLHNKGTSRHIGFYPTKAEAQQGIKDYKATNYSGTINYNKLAKDPTSWNKEAKAVLSKLSNSKYAVKVPPSLLQYKEIGGEWNE